MERAGQNPAETQFNKLSATSSWIKGYTDKLCYLAHSEEMYWEIRFHSLLTGLMQNHILPKFQQHHKNTRDLN